MNVYQWHNRVFVLFSAVLLTGCFEISNLKGREQSLNDERAQIEAHIAAYDKHISFYKSQLQGAASITPGKDPLFDSLNGYLLRVNEEIAREKDSIERTYTYLNILREESARSYSLQPSK